MPPDRQRVRRVELFASLFHALRWSRYATLSLFQSVQRLLQFPATLLLCRSQARFRAMGSFQRVPPIIVERAIVIELLLFILRVAGESEIQPARVVVATKIHSRGWPLSSQLRREAAAINSDSGG